MANSLYDAGRAGFLSGSISWSSDTIKVNLLDGADYTPNLSADDFLNDIAGAAIVATSAALSSKTTTAGVADAADVTFSTVTGDQSEYIGCYKDTGSSATSPLIFLIDTASGLPVTPVGQDISLAFDNGSNKVFRL